MFGKPKSRAETLLTQVDRRTRRGQRPRLENGRHHDFQNDMYPDKSSSGVEIHIMIQIAPKISPHLIHPPFIYTAHENESNQKRLAKCPASTKPKSYAQPLLIPQSI